MPAAVAARRSGSSSIFAKELVKDGSLEQPALPLNPGVVDAQFAAQGGGCRPVHTTLGVCGAAELSVGTSGNSLAMEPSSMSAGTCETDSCQDVRRRQLARVELLVKSCMTEIRAKARRGSSPSPISRAKAVKAS